MNQLSLSARLFIWIFLCALIPVILLTVFYFNAFKTEFLQQEKAHLSYQADKKVKEVESYIDERLTDALMLSRSQEAERVLKTLQPLYRKIVEQGSEYTNQEKQLRPFFNRFQQRGYYDIFVISPLGEIIFSLEHEADFATNILQGDFADSGLNQVVVRAKNFLQASVSPFEYYVPSFEAAAFIAAPVVRNGHLLGVVALQINTDIIQRVTLDVSGSMQSQEVVVASLGKDGYSFQAEVKYDDRIIIGKDLPLSGVPKTLYKAMNGERGISIELDYRNVDVIAATRYIPSMQWGLVMKEDLAEAMAVFDQLLWVVVAIVILVLIVVTSIAIWLGRSVAKPLSLMTRATQAMSQGDMDLKVDVHGFKELSQLAVCFNEMAASLRHAQDALNQQVDARTHELKMEILLRKNNEAALAESYKDLNYTTHNLQVAQDQLIESEKMASLGSLVAGIAHEINTPLGIAVTSTSLFKDSLAGMHKSHRDNTLTVNLFKEGLEDLGNILALIDSNLSRTVNLVKNFKQVAVDQTNIHKSKFYLYDLVESLLSSLNPETKKYPVEIQNQVAKEVIMDSYSGDFYQLLTNLILNAMIHGFEGKSIGILIVKATMLDHELTLSVKDNGNGIASECIPQLFEPFYTTKRGKGGSGLGLSIVHNIVKQKLHGHIRVESQVGAGTEFIIICPDSC